MAQSEAVQRIFDLSGGALCLDFANTLDDRPDPHPNEYLESYADLLAFALQTGSLPDGDLDRLREASARRPADAAAVLDRGLILREVIYRLSLALAEGQPVPAADLAALNGALAEALAHARVVELDDSPRRHWTRASGGHARGHPNDDAAGAGRHDRPGAGGRLDDGAPVSFGWAWADDPIALEMPLWPVARSAAELLTSSALASLRLCAADTCAWLFLDTSRNGSRRWCSMRTCGNRAKARRHHARVRAASTVATSA